MVFTNQLVHFFLVFLLFVSPSLAKTSSIFKPSALVLPVTKDSATGQYVTQIKQRTPFVPVKLTVDLGGQFLWVDCEQGYVSSSYKPAHCGSAECSLAESKACGDCFNGPKPGCNNNTCGLFPDNTIKKLSTGGELAEDVVSLQSTDGSNPGTFVSAPDLLFTCGSTFLLEDLAKGVKGMVGFGKGSVGFPSLLANAFHFKRKFAICLGSSSGVIFIGDGPYNFLPNNDVSTRLTYTPLLTNPVSTAGASFEGESSVEYFIGVKSIKVNNVDVSINKRLLNITEEGNGGTKISTVDRYTRLETSIYNAVTNAFVKAIAKVPRVKAVAPFSICYNSKSFGSTRLGPGVPTIELVLESKSLSWRIFGANSMVDVGKNVLCLGFVDGGAEPRTSIVIGAYQIENNLLQFDLSRSRLGFSSLLFGQQTTCGNFNFTSVA